MPPRRTSARTRAADGSSGSPGKQGGGDGAAHVNGRYPLLQAQQGGPDEPVVGAQFAGGVAGDASHSVAESVIAKRLLAGRFRVAAARSVQVVRLHQSRAGFLPRTTQFGDEFVIFGALPQVLVALASRQDTREARGRRYA
jgi:hypothetical protein